MFSERRRSRSPRIDRRERERYRSRSRSRDRKKRRVSREREGTEDSDGRRDRRDRERGGADKDKKKKRSRSRDRSERKREKREKDRGERGDRKERKPEFREGDFKIKEEPIDGKFKFANITAIFYINHSISLFLYIDYPDYSENFVNYGAEVKYEDDDEKKFRPSEMDRQMENNGQQNFTNEDGEYDE